MTEPSLRDPDETLIKNSIILNGVHWLKQTITTFNTFFLLLLEFIELKGLIMCRSFELKGFTSFSILKLNGITVSRNLKWNGKMLCKNLELKSTTMCWNLELKGLPMCTLVKLLSSNSWQTVLKKIKHKPHQNITYYEPLTAEINKLDFNKMKLSVLLRTVKCDSMSSCQKIKTIWWR